MLYPAHLLKKPAELHQTQVPDQARQPRKCGSNRRCALRRTCRSAVGKQFRAITR
jgi:hypothetical protein